jgi:hypothetical protein
MSKAQLDGESRVHAYLSSFGLRVEWFAKAELRGGKTPDFRVFSGDDLAFYCEVKTAQEDEWLDKQLAAVPPGRIAGGLRPDPTYNWIANYLHGAEAQLDAGRPDLLSVLTGNAYCASGEVWQSHVRPSIVADGPLTGPDRAQKATGAGLVAAPRGPAPVGQSVRRDCLTGSC